MNNKDIRTAVETRLQNDWPYPAIPIAYENASFDPPDENHWIRVTVQPFTHAYKGLNDCKEIRGLIGIQIFSPLRTGTELQEQIKDSILAIFDTSYNELQFYDSSVSLIGEQEGWYQCNIFIGYRAKSSI